MSDIQWSDRGLPFSNIYQDKYFDEDDGLKESMYTFCEANRLSDRWQKLNPSESFTIFETGFGTGLNFHSVRKLWKSCAQEGYLRFYSVEKHPLSKNDISKAMSCWPQLNELTSSFLLQYKPTMNSFHYITFPEERISLAIFFKDVISALTEYKHLTETVQKVDAWFLDGFAPSKNPEMWSRDVFKLMVQTSQNQATFSTFTSAGEVRRGLMEQGFTVEKAKGFGRKRHMLCGQLNKKFSSDTQ